MSGTIVIGIDGGGSKTRALVADETGAKIIEVDGPASAVRPGQHEHSADVITALVKDALFAADMGHVYPKAVCVGVAGVGVESERQALWQALQEREIAEEVIVHTDAMVALDDAFGEGAGILLISGTGSIAWGRSPAGTLGRCGGWGPNIGDEGSGQWIGRRALSIVAAASDGREPETHLTGAILTAAQVNDIQELIAWAAQATPMQLATLAPAVMSVADAGDLRANSLLTLAAEELVLHVRTLARSLFVDERSAIPVAFAGGLLARGSSLRKRLELRLKSAVPGATVRTQPVDAARGAVRGALRYLGVELA